MTIPSNSDRIKQHTIKWLRDFIIEHNICPFAKHPFENDRLIYEIVIETKLEAQLHALIDACCYLDKNSDMETSLVVYPKGLSDFDDYLDFLEIANQLMHKQGYEGIYQLASFHPDYCFDGVEPDDASNFTNRSPYPMLHLIREESLEKALEHYPNPEKIPTRNIRYTRKLGVEFLRENLLKGDSD